MSKPGTLRAAVIMHVSQGMDGRQIQAALAGRASQDVIRVTLCDVRRTLGLEAPRPASLLPQRLSRALRPAADARGMRTSELAIRLLEHVVNDKLVDAILDDGAVR